MTEPEGSGIKKKVTKSLSVGKSNKVSTSMVSWEQIPILGSRAIKSISYIRKYLSLKEKEDLLNKREKAINEREKKVGWLELIESDNRTRIAQLVETKLIDLNPGLEVPRLRFTIELVNLSIFDLKINKIKYDVQCNVDSTRSISVLENEFYPEELDLPRQGKCQLSSTRDIPQGIAQTITEEAKGHPSGEMRWVFRLMYTLSSEKHHISSTAGSAPTKSVQNEWIIRTTR